MHKSLLFALIVLVATSVSTFYNASAEDCDKQCGAIIQFYSFRECEGAGDGCKVTRCVIANNACGMTLPYYWDNCADDHLTCSGWAE